LAADSVVGGASDAALADFSALLRQQTAILNSPFSILHFPFSIRLRCRFPFPIPFLAVLSLLLSACNVTKHLDASKGERLLIKNTVAIKSREKMGLSAKTALSYSLNPYFRQQPNKRSFGFFYTRLWLHYRYFDRKSGFANWVNKKVAEPPSIYDEALAQRTASNLQNQMRQRGYFAATCAYKPALKGAHKAKVTYTLDLGPIYSVDSVAFASRDSQVLRILEATKANSLVGRGRPLDGRVFEAEKLRITAELKNRGYAYFVPNFVEFSGDSSGTKANVRVEVLPPTDSTLHQTYRLNKIEVYTSLVPDLAGMRSEQRIGGLYFAAAEPRFTVRPERLYQAIAIQPDSLYRQSDFDKTLRKLNALGVYRFVSLRPLQDTVEANRMNVVVNLSPNKRFSFGGDFEFNYTRSSLSGGLLGLSPSFFGQNRNVFRGAERLVNSVQYNVEFDVATRRRFIFSQEFKFQNELVFPRFFDYLGFWRTAHRIRFGKKNLVPTSLYERMRADGQARFSLNYNYLRVTDFYSYNLFNASFGYDVRSNLEHQYAWDHIGIDVLRPRFDSLLIPSEFLKRSFGNQLFTGFFLRSFNYTYGSKVNAFGERWTLRLGTELSGLEVLAANRLWATAFGPQKWTISDLDYAEYLRLDLDAVYTRNFRQELTGAVRFGFGVATPFGDASTVPFVKQFFVGGPSGLRAWRIRELGPGGFFEKDEQGNLRPPADGLFYQAADMRLEFNGELRFPLFWWFKGAVFVDGGNIWTLRPDPDRPLAQLRWDSYKNIALGTGLGFRGDFDFFVIRLDFGLPLRRPFQEKDRAYYWIPDRFSKLQLRDFNPNLAVGYPF
jgi:outer membrane protein insertion porin family